MKELLLSNLKTIVIVTVFIVILVAGWRLYRSHRPNTSESRLQQVCQDDASDMPAGEGTNSYGFSICPQLAPDSKR